jgi:hypothetical protein
MRRLRQPGRAELAGEARTGKHATEATETIEAAKLIDAFRRAHIALWPPAPDWKSVQS